MRWDGCPSIKVYTNSGLVHSILFSQYISNRKKAIHRIPYSPVPCSCTLWEFGIAQEFSTSLHKGKTHTKPFLTGNTGTGFVERYLLLSPNVKFLWIWFTGRPRCLKDAQCFEVFLVLWRWAENSWKSPEELMGADQRLSHYLGGQEGRIWNSRADAD